MRQIYSSPRIENVERIVALLGDAGIATSVTNHRSWAGRDYKRASYSDGPDSSTWPQVWIVNAEDQPRARALLREAGIEPAVRYADELARSREPGAQAKRGTFAMYLRLGLLAIIALLILMQAFGLLKWTSL